ncbi:unnamed protein product [Bemisia tabaci]|uniref:Peptidase C1A papain C-terminal domain-containing protein n=2 Tax=Bemisia tabaci TaxID=7038 RepID=A0A9P0CDB5_BEMTA|nr:unnamed protein product [Bemisia tabaci]
MELTRIQVLVFLCVSFELWELARTLDDSTIVIPDPARLAREINAAQKSWVARDFYGRPVTYGDVKERLGSRLRRRKFSRVGFSRGDLPFYLTSDHGASYSGSKESCLDSNIDKITSNGYQDMLPTVPRSFDLRRYYPACESLNTIRQQSDCGSCWAVSSAGALSDRLCIASGGKINVHISAENLVTCCGACGDGCDGGDPMATWEHFMKNGEITGGDYGSGIGCKPYSIAPEEGTETVDIDAEETPPCVEECTNPNYKIPYKEAPRYKTRNTYILPDTNLTIAQLDIMLNGPIVPSFMVYSDFMLYSSGVYRHTKGLNMGGHAVKLIGWGREKGVDYWLAANSWGRDWGIKGFFKIRRGANECLMEEYMVAGEPDVRDVSSMDQKT